MKICYLYPNLLNVNGSRGNVVCLCERALRRGIPATVTGVPAGHPFAAAEYDLIYMGAGHGEQSPRLLTDALRTGPQLREYVEAGGVLLAVAEGFELLAKTITFADGSLHEGMGVLDMTVAYGKARRTGNFMFDCGGDIGAVVAFQNHAGEASLGEGVSPLGVTKDGTPEGARYKNVFGSYGHGPLLPRNPRLADAILRLAVTEELPPLDDALENTAHDYMAEKLQ